MSKFYVRMTDKFMSGWGPARGKKNVLCVECDTLEQAEQVERAAHRRPEMIYVMIVGKPTQNRADRYVSHKHFSDLGGVWLKN